MVMEVAVDAVSVACFQMRKDAKRKAFSSLTWGTPTQTLRCSASQSMFMAHPVIEVNVESWAQN